MTDAGIEVLIPEQPDIETVNNVIFKELCRGVVSENSKQQYLAIIDKLAAKGSQGVILGCTEIGMMISREDTQLPVLIRQGSMPKRPHTCPFRTEAPVRADIALSEP